VRSSLCLFAACAALAVTTAGCLVTRADLERAPFEGRVMPAAPTTAVADVLFTDHTGEEVERVRLRDNEHASLILLDSLTTWLSEAGYAVEQRAAAVGLAADSLALVSLERDGQAAPELHAGPVALDPLLQHDAQLFAAARAPETAPRAAAETEARRVVAVLRVRGRSVPVERSAAQAMLTGLLTLGRKADFDRSALQAELFVLDADTGALVWASREGQDLQAPDVTSAIEMARALADRLPPAGLPNPYVPSDRFSAR
jgi:hypothetical protein